MNDWLIERLACPACRGNLNPGAKLGCVDCGHEYDVVDGIPLLTPPAPEDGDQKSQQAAYFDEEVNPQFELDRPHGCGRVYEFLMNHKLEMPLRKIGDVRGKAMLNVCCGSGMDAEFFATRRAAMCGLDISLENAKRAIERSRKYGFPLQAVVGDAERLPFKDGAFDISFVHDGLHHLPDPLVGVREMARVASQHVAMVEPARAFGTRVAVTFGVSEEVEDAGNVVYRFTQDELLGLAKELHAPQSSFERYFMFYRHEPGPFLKLFSTAPLFPVYKLGFAALGAVLGSSGNKCCFHMTRPTRT